MNAEQRRLDEDRRRERDWRRWGPYLSERQWGTVREDYSADGNAWDYFPFAHAHLRAYRWGEDGLCGVSDDEQRLCLALALWNGRDPLLKERLFGLTNGQGNHGEDVKEYYYYLDATPTGSYLKALYKYPQLGFPYEHLVEASRRRGKREPEYELIDTGIFDDDRYFDVFVEYAKASPDDLLMRVTVHNRGPDAATLHVLPHVWFRNTWSWGDQHGRKPEMHVEEDGSLGINHPTLGYHWLYADGDHELLFCENETNVRTLYGQPKPGPFKDGINEAVVHAKKGAVSPARVGTKAAAHYALRVPAGGSAAVRCRLVYTLWTDDIAARDDLIKNPFRDFDAVMSRRKAEADEFYDQMQRGIADPDARSVQRQALAGMVWTKQFFCYEVPAWLNGDPGQPPPPPSRRRGRNNDWENLNCADVISMPDKWEYPWFAAWDLAFHMLPMALVDPEFAKEQLRLLTREWYMHPNGQLPAYEWNFSDVNPPVHAWATWRVFQIDRARRGDSGDLAFLERVFHKLLLNFTWWVNRKDAQGRNLFQGGFLGLDNIGVFDRSRPLPTGGFINQADGTSWMAMYSLNMMRIALELALHNPVYQDTATKFFEHFLHIAEAMTNMAGSGIGLWDEEDKFYYDELILPDGRMIPLKLRSMVGLIPLFAVEVIEPEMLARLPAFARRMNWFLVNRPGLAQLVSRWEEPGRGSVRLLSLLRGHRVKMLLRRALDETEFLSPHGVRALSKDHDENPYVFRWKGHEERVHYVPGDSDSNLFGGNSNWRGPVWFPVNFLLIESMRRFHHYYGDDFKIECPTGSGSMVTILQAAQEVERRLCTLFLRDRTGRRASFGGVEKFQTDPHFRDYLFFNEYFDGDTGRGLGALRQTGWTGLVANLLHPRRWSL